MILRRLLQWSDTLRDHARRRTWEPSRALGRWGEDVAHRHLQAEGYTIVARNWRTRSGSAEVDLIAWHEDELVLVEVKTKRSGAFAAPETRIDHDKQQALFRAAREYARRAELPPDQFRVDVVAITLEPQTEIRVLRDVFRGRSEPRRGL